MDNHNHPAYNIIHLTSEDGLEYLKKSFRSYYYPQYYNKENDEYAIFHEASYNYDKQFKESIDIRDYTEKITFYDYVTEKLEKAFKDYHSWVLKENEREDVLRASLTENLKSHLNKIRDTSAGPHPEQKRIKDILERRIIAKIRRLKGQPTIEEEIRSLTPEKIYTYYLEKKYCPPELTSMDAYQVTLSWLRDELFLSDEEIKSKLKMRKLNLSNFNENARKRKNKH